MTNHKNRIAFLKTLMLCAAAAILALRGAPLEAAANAGGGAALEGFPLGTKIIYAVQAQGKYLARGSASIGEDRRFSFSLPEKIAYESLPVKYNFEIQEPGRAAPLFVSLHVKEEDKPLAFTASGLPALSAVETRTASAGTIAGKADWAGLLQRDVAGRLQDVVAEQGFEIALLGNIVNDAPHPASRIIRVQTGGFQCNSNTVPVVSVCQPGNRANLDRGVEEYIVKSMKGLAAQLSTVMTQQTAILGKFFDAKMQLESQQLFQRLTAEAHKEYHPSEIMCEFGTFMRSLPKAEQKTILQKTALNRGLMTDITNRIDANTADGRQEDIRARIEQFRISYCNPQDNNGRLATICTGASLVAGNAPRRNRDIDYTRLLAAPLTLDTDFANQGTANPAQAKEQETEEDLLALGRHLYWSKAFDPVLARAISGKYHQIMQARHLSAMANVAHNSYASQIAMKSKETPLAGAQQGGAAYMRALLRDLGLTVQEIDEMIGKNPSYYAQMEILTKKIYQSPDFYTNLYDKPANVERIGASLDAIKLMQARDQFEAALRREMLTSLMVEAALISKEGQADRAGPTRGGPAESVRRK